MSMNSCDVGTGAISFHVVFIMGDFEECEEDAGCLPATASLSQRIVEFDKISWRLSYR